MAIKAMARKQAYKIGEACRLLDIQPYVLRYWETEFPLLHPQKSQSGQRVYTDREIQTIRRIKQLLYDEGYTIAGAKKKLESDLGTGASAAGTLFASSAEGEEVGESAVPDDSQALPDSGMESGALDSPMDERIESLRRGIGEALAEARELLALLGRRNP